MGRKLSSWLFFPDLLWQLLIQTGQIFSFWPKINFRLLLRGFFSFLWVHSQIENPLLSFHTTVNVCLLLSCVEVQRSHFWKSGGQRLCCYVTSCSLSICTPSTLHPQMCCINWLLLIVSLLCIISLWGWDQSGVLLGRVCVCECGLKCIIIFTIRDPCWGALGFNLCNPADDPMYHHGVKAWRAE